MSDDDLKVAVRFKGNLRTLLEWYSESLDMAPSAVVKALVADKLSKYIGSPPVSPEVATRSVILLCFFILLP